MSNIFGRRNHNSRTKALVDANSAEEFDEMLNKLETEWCMLEPSQHSNNEPKLFSWLKKNCAMVLKDNMITPVRERAGLGCPPEMYTQNTSECCNSMVKRSIGKKKEWAEFCNSLETTVQSQEKELVKAIHGMGEYRLSHDFKHLETEVAKWMKMSTEQCELHIRRCLSTPLEKLSLKSHPTGPEAIDGNGIFNLSISYHNCGITTLSHNNLQRMWSFASTILTKKDGVLALPWDKSGSQRLVYDGDCAPPCQVNICQPAGSFKCSYMKFRSAMICAHVLAVAEQEQCLLDFLATVRQKRKEPNPYLLLSNNLPKSAGNKPTSKRKGKPNRKIGPLMEIQSSSTNTTSNYQSRVDNASSVAASALLTLSKSRPSVENDYFSLKPLEGTQVRTCYGCGEAIRVPPNIPPPPHDVCGKQRVQIVQKARWITKGDQ